MKIINKSQSKNTISIISVLLLINYAVYNYHIYSAYGIDLLLILFMCYFVISFLIVVMVNIINKKKWKTGEITGISLLLTLAINVIIGLIVVMTDAIHLQHPWWLFIPPLPHAIPSSPNS